MKNRQQGFATILLMTMIPALLALGGGALFTYALLKQDLATLNTCRSTELNIHNKAGKVLAKLMSLNPRAKNLRRKNQKAQMDFNKAALTGNATGMAMAEARIAAILMERELLWIQQKGLITSANGLLKSGDLQNSAGIRKEWMSHQRPMLSWLRSTITLKAAKVPTLAVKPDLPDIAPIYETVSNFETEQTWSQSWTVRYELIGALQTFLRFSGSLERSCSTSLFQEGKKWIAKLNASSTPEAKSWSRGWF